VRSRAGHKDVTGLSLMSQLDLYTIGEVAAILGVSPHTIRAWERRHGIVKPLRTTSRQRRYRVADVDLLRAIKRAIDLGGMSLKLAYRTVSEGQQVPEPRLPRAQRRAPVAEPIASAAGIWRGVADMLPELILIMKATGEIEESNVSAARAFGVTRQRLAGRAFADLIDPFDRAKAVLLHRPQLRTVKGWELNVMTRSGPRLYSFQTWPVLRGDETSLALIGTEMFAEPQGRPIDTGTQGIQPQLPGAAGYEEPVAASSFQKVLEQLPFGVAVTTVGREPRIVYANARLMQSLGHAPKGITGKPLRELLHNRDAAQILKSVVASRSGATLRAVQAHGAHVHARERFVNVAIKPLFSSSRQVTSVLLVVDDVTAEVVWQKYLERLVLDRRIETARTAGELADVGVEYLTMSVQGPDFAILIATNPDASHSPYATASSVGWKGFADKLATSRAGAAVRESAATGKSGELDISEGTRTFRVTTRPLVARGALGSNEKLGAVAWRRPQDQLVTVEQLATIEAFVPRLALAAELLRVRMDAAHRASQLEAVVAAASVIPLSGRTGLGIRFLERLCQALGADHAAIGRVAGSKFVVEVAYSAQGDRAQSASQGPAPRVALEALKSREPVARTVPVRTEVRRGRRQPTRSVHELAVPLILDQEVYAVIIVSRTGMSPFGQRDVQLVQTLSGVALLAVSLARRDSFPP
jgi:PAS domain S-box-containing protein